MLGLRSNRPIWRRLQTENPYAVEVVTSLKGLGVRDIYENLCVLKLEI